MSTFIAGCQYLPPVEFFAHWHHHGSITIEAHEHFQKRTWRNKTAILGPEQPMFLSIPLKKGKHEQMPIREVLISYDEAWHRIHFNSIKTIYGKTSFFHEIEMDIHHILFSEKENLWDMNMELLHFVHSLIPSLGDMYFTNTYQSSYTETVDLRKGVAAGAHQMPERIFPTYDQVHRLAKSFIPNLSILDVLCHLGPGTDDYLARCASALYHQA